MDWWLDREDVTQGSHCSLHYCWMCHRLNTEQIYLKKRLFDHNHKLELQPWTKIYKCCNFSTFVRKFSFTLKGQYWLQLRSKLREQVYEVQHTKGTKFTLSKSFSSSIVCLLATSSWTVWPQFFTTDSRTWRMRPFNVTHILPKQPSPKQITKKQLVTKQFFSYLPPVHRGPHVGFCHSASSWWPRWHI